MLIRKLFKFEGSHTVRNCTSKRCSNSVHGHSFLVEVFFEASSLDGGQMVIDFGLMKENVGKIIDAFDHTHMIWNKEDKAYIDFFKRNNERWIDLPCSPSAEMLSVMFFALINKIVNSIQFKNGEQANLFAVRVHETATGYAEAKREDLKRLWENAGLETSNIQFSLEIEEELGSDILNCLLRNEIIKEIQVPDPQKQIY